MSENRRHFLVVAAASRGARLFIKKALQQGHDVTAICRADSDDAALARMNTLLDDVILTEEQGSSTTGEKPVGKGTLKATNQNVTLSETYQSLLQSDPSIDAVCCFVGVTKVSDMFNKQNKLYSQTISAITTGMQNSRLIELYYHGSSGTEGVPGQSYAKLPDNFPVKWLMNMFNHMPIVKNYRESEGVLAKAGEQGLPFVIFRPAYLTNKPAKRRYRYCFDTTGFDNEMLPIKSATTQISREDVVEEILRVASLSISERSDWFGHGVYLVDMKVSFYQNS
jgi:hypothetical protein